MTKRTLLAASALLALVLAGGCGQPSEYDRVVRRELASGALHDSLFLSYRLGMSRQAFYDSSWALNRGGVVMQGPRNEHIQFKLPDALPFEATMLFYADFHADSVFQVRVEFSYDGWAPWAPRLSSDSLVLDVVHLLETWYGEGFFEVSGTEWVKVDGNRRIVAAKRSDMDVAAVFTDLVRARAMEEDQ